VDLNDLNLQKDVENLAKNLNEGHQRIIDAKKESVEVVKEVAPEDALIEDGVKQEHFFVSKLVVVPVK